MERSKTALAAGGPRIIRFLPLTDRLVVGSMIAGETGKERAVLACIGRAMRLEKEAGNGLLAAKLGLKYGTEENRAEAARILVQSMIGSSAFLPSLGRIRKLAARHGIDEQELSGIAWKAVTEKIGQRRFITASILAYRFGFHEDMLTLQRLERMIGNIRH